VGSARRLLGGRRAILRASVFPFTRIERVPACFGEAAGRTGLGVMPKPEGVQRTRGGGTFCDFALAASRTVDAVVADSPKQICLLGHGRFSMAGQLRGLQRMPDRLAAAVEVKERPSNQ
jgi:hypothetical protein